MAEKGAVMQGTMTDLVANLEGMKIDRSYIMKKID